jgi:hypothetical protein
MHKRTQFQNCLLPWNVAASSYRTGMASFESVEEKRCASSKKSVRCGENDLLSTLSNRRRFPASERQLPCVLPPYSREVLHRGFCITARDS